MVGVVLISHGDMAEGMYNSADLFFGDTGLQQVTTVCFMPEDSFDKFDNSLSAAIKKVDTGDGVIVLADLLGGTPCNRAAAMANEQVHVIAGMNLPMFVELLGLRMSGNVDIDNLITTGHEGIVNLNELLNGK